MKLSITCCGGYTKPTIGGRGDDHAVNTNDPAAMNLTLNNATDVTQRYKELGEKVKIEVVTFEPGLHMLRDDTSPVKARIEQMALSTPEVSFRACGNTQEKMHQAELRPEVSGERYVAFESYVDIVGPLAHV